MNILNNSLTASLRKWQILPFIICGLIIFSVNSHLELNYFVKGYVTVLELQTIFLILYFFIFKFKNNRRRK